MRDQATDIRKQFWEEVTINTSTNEDFEKFFRRSCLSGENEWGRHPSTVAGKKLHRLKGEAHESLRIQGGEALLLMIQQIFGAIL